MRHQARDGGWHYPFPWTVRGFDPIPEGWMSAMGQGQAMSLLWRAWQLKKQPAFRRAARRAVRPFQRSVAEGGLRADFDGAVWYEEYPTSRPSLVLNGYTACSVFTTRRRGRAARPVSTVAASGRSV